MYQGLSRYLTGPGMTWYTPTMRMVGAYMKKKNIHLTSRQVEQIEALAKDHNLSFAEMLRRALDASPIMLQAAGKPPVPPKPIRKSGKKETE